MSFNTPFNFDYAITGITTTGEIVTDNGQSFTSMELDPGDERAVFTEAVASTMHHFYTMKIEKEGRQLTEVTLTVKNIRYE